ncbi:hypothetical protein BCR39DRAFT_560938 [Naematelia encephala]|uniref:Uncharacterized protein n=1 Tax=Naematelia encephala TaxID=71784 RepID=A0A1Y2ATJ6_9TREE|nr:hypothetical protein BCR39DRAFT_560938 [Naematelia encephala]
MSQPNARKILSARRHDSMFVDDKLVHEMTSAPSQAPTSATSDQHSQGQSRAQSFPTQRPQAFKSSQPSSRGGFGAIQQGRPDQRPFRGLPVSAASPRLRQEAPVQLQGGRPSAAKIETLTEDGEQVEYPEYVHSEALTKRKAPAIKLPPFQVNHKFGDHMQFISSLEQTPVWAKSVEKAKRLDGSNIDEKAISALLDVHTKCIHRMLSQLAKMTEGCKQLEKIKEDTLEEKMYMTERYVEAGKVLSEQCNALQVSTRSIQGRKRRRVTAGSVSESQDY